MARPQTSDSGGRRAGDGVDLERLDDVDAELPEDSHRDEGQHDEHLLGQLRGGFAEGLLEEQRTSFEQSEKDDRRGTRSDGNEEEVADQASLLERLESLELLQQKLGTVGDQVLSMTNTSQPSSPD